MLRQTQFVVFILIFTGVCAFFLFHKKTQTHLSNAETTTEEISPAKPQDQKTSDIPSATQTPTPNNVQGDSNSQDPSQVLQLTSANFESLIPKCFQGTPCQLTEDAWRTYEVFKTSGNTHATSDLLSFLKIKIKDPTSRDAYREDLRKMIDDFYPAEEKQFHEASYYASLGDNQKALDLYLDLQQKSVDDSSLRPAPNVNIANVLYDLGRFSDALIYYRMAQDDLEMGSQRAQNQKDLIKFISQRIVEIQAKGL